MCRSESGPSVTLCNAVTLCVCVRRISLGGEGNELYPEFSFVFLLKFENLRMVVLISAGLSDSQLLTIVVRDAHLVKNCKVKLSLEILCADFFPVFT